ncbi:hypothetical protein Hypma_003465 [Hypsizygus marmoreus]|uniref:CxC1-like cysteine cluster associated with KDZ transposases domain-containing protein n=1 Tax=Hypsizygus marmoreus TaxID=39966 RepID=A0A369J9A1_HYPMA|nr:hypothetical protein Hypma_003465 [Hypsizygus marmoreus]
MELMCATNSLREPVPVVPSSLCTCGEPGRNLDVVLVRFDRLERISITMCVCAPAALQLLRRGTFPSAPLAPTLAVDLKVLDFVTSLFVNVAPNNTAWCKTVETFLSKQGYKLTTKDSLRKRFGNALQWYNALQDATTRHVDNVLHHVRRLQFDMDNGVDVSNDEPAVGDEPSSPCAAPAARSNTTHHEGHDRPPSTSVPPEQAPAPPGTPSPSTPATPRSTRHKMTAPPATPSLSTPATPRSTRHEMAGFADHNQTPSTPRRYPRATVEEVEDEDTPTDRRVPPTVEDFEVEATPTNRPPPGNDNFDNLSSGDVPLSGSKRAREADEDADSDPPTEPSNPFPRPLPRSRPSDYLRSRCPLCFGGKFPRVRTASSDPDAIVCIDACFTQKRNRQARDPPRMHPRTVFIPEDDANRMETYVASIRPSKTSKKKADKRSRHESEDEDDFFEGSLQVPRSVLDGCESGFTAADDRREKASTQFFDDTALMALVCRHDIVLWMVNMRSAGEKQHYAQYHQRLYTLDRQVDHAQTETIEKLGWWLARRTRHALAKCSAADEMLQACGQSEEFLRAQWKAQVKAQTKPLPRRSKGRGREAVEQVIRLRKGRDVLKDRVRELEAVLIDPYATPDMFADAEMGLETAKVSLEESNVRVGRKERALGIEDRVELQRLLKSPFIATRMNARALKQRLRDKLRFCKFELDRLERSFRKQVNDEKVNAHTASSVSRREPSIQRLAQDYNRLCDKMAKMIQERKAPRGARCPQKIESKGLFALDVDDAIWQDVGLDDDDCNTEPPPWLSSERVRDGVRALLEHDRCVEEEVHLRHECRAMREWFSEEWATINVAFDNTGDESLRYEMGLRRTALCRLCAIWQQATRSLDFGDVESLPPWGPSLEEIFEAQIARSTASVDEYEEEFAPCPVDEDDDDDDMYFDGDEDGEMVLLETLDAMDLADSFRSVSIDDDLHL